jgi:hypothetical protein
MGGRPPRGLGGWGGGFVPTAFKGFVIMNLTYRGKGRGRGRVYICMCMYISMHIIVV